MYFISNTVLLFVILDPLGNIPVFLSVLRGVPQERRQRVILRELLISLVIMVMFLFAGKGFLNILNLRGDTVSIAGGIVLFLIALRMISPGRGVTIADENYGEPFIVPLAIPLTAGPSILATLILMGDKKGSDHISLLFSLITAWVFTLVILLGSGHVYDLIGKRGVTALERLMGMFLVMISVQIFLDGIHHYFLRFS